MLGAHSSPASHGHCLAESLLVVTRALSEQIWEAQKHPRHHSTWAWAGTSPASVRLCLPNSSHELESGLGPLHRSCWGPGWRSRIWHQQRGKGRQAGEPAVVRDASAATLAALDQPLLIWPWDLSMSPASSHSTPPSPPRGNGILLPSPVAPWPGQGPCPRSRGKGKE